MNLKDAVEPETLLKCTFVHCIHIHTHTKKKQWEPVEGYRSQMKDLTMAKATAILSNKINNVVLD